MTVKDIASVAGVSPDTVARKGKELFPTLFEKGKRTRFSQSQATEIMSRIRKVNMVVPQTAEVPPQTAEVMTTSQLVTLIPIIVAETIKAMQTYAPGPVTARQRAVEAPEVPVRAQIRQLVVRYAGKFDDGNYRAAWNRLFSEYELRYGTGDTARKAKSFRLSRLDYLERAGELEHLCTAAILIYGLGVRT